MLFTSASEWAVLLLTLLAGWLLGLASHSGGRKWRERYSTERDAHAASRRDAEARLTTSETRLRELEADRGQLAQSDARIAELERDRVALERANARVAELERENARLASAPPAAAAAPVRTVMSAPLNRSRSRGGSWASGRSGDGSTGDRAMIPAPAGSRPPARPPAPPPAGRSGRGRVMR